MDELEQFANIIDKTIAENPAPTIKEGGIIKDGANSNLDYLRNLMKNGDAWEKQYEEQERKRTGIPTLKVTHNKVFGYYIEITNSNLSKVPDDYIRKQTLTGAERLEKLPNLLLSWMFIIHLHLLLLSKIMFVLKLTIVQILLLKMADILFWKKFFRLARMFLMIWSWHAEILKKHSL